MSNTATAPRFRRITTGLYGTGIHRDRYETEHINGFCDCTTVELVLDMRTSHDGCWERYICPCGDLTETLGEWYRTLRDAKADITDRKTA